MAAAITELTACGMTRHEYEAQALAMLEEKYGEEFKVQEYFTETAEPGREFKEMTEKAERITIPFEKGRITMTKEEFTARGSV